MHFKPLKIFQLPNSIYIHIRRWLQQKLDFLLSECILPLKIKIFSTYILYFFTPNWKILMFYFIGKGQNVIPQNGSGICRWRKLA